MNLVDGFLLVVGLLVVLAGTSLRPLPAVGTALGVVGGLWLGVRWIPGAAAGLDPGVGAAVLATVVLLVAVGAAAGLGAFAGTRLGGAVSAADRATGAGMTAGARAGGSVAALAMFAAVAWVVGAWLGSASITPLSGWIRTSPTLQVVNELAPWDASVLLGDFHAVTTSAGLTTAVLPYVREPAAEVEPAERGPSLNDAVRATARSAVSIVQGEPRVCPTGAAAGVVIAHDMVLTTARAVAGAVSVAVGDQSGEQSRAMPVLVDRQRDVALLHVPGLGLRAAPLEVKVPVAGSVASLAGLDGAGHSVLDPVRVGTTATLTGLDIDARAEVDRSLVVLRGRITAGQSGAPLVDGAGKVRGIALAASPSRNGYGYALGLADLADVLRVAKGKTPKPVPPGPCPAP